METKKRIADVLIRMQCIILVIWNGARKIDISDVRCLDDRDWLPPRYLVDIVFHLQLSPVSYLTNPINSGPLSLVLFLKLQEYKLLAHALTH